MNEISQKSDDYLDMTIAGPLKYVVRPVNWVLIRCVFLLPVVVIIGFPAVIVAFLFFSQGLGFLIMAIAFGIPIGVFFSWAITSMVLVSIFGATCKAKQQAMIMLMLGIWPTCLALSFTDTLLYLSIPPDITVYVLLSMIVSAFVLGFWWVFKITGDAEGSISLKVHAQSLSFIVVLFLSVLEMFYPYPVTDIQDVVFDECEVKRTYSKYKADPKFVKTCRASFEENGVERKIYLSPGENEVIRIRHGIFDHYRSNFSD